MIRGRAKFCPALVALISGLLFQVTGIAAAPFDVTFDSRPFHNFKAGDTTTRFGKLEFVGGIEFTSSNQHVGALSGLAMFADRSGFVAVTDTGFWFTTGIERDGNGRPVALKNGRMAPILDTNGKPFRHKWNVDAESVIIDGSEVTVAFERDNRVLRYQLDLSGFASLPKPVKLNIGVTTLRGNKGLETIARAPATSPLKGAAIIVSERSFAAKGQIRGAIINGPSKGRFTVKRAGKFDITDGDFLPNGDLILLERRYNLAKGLGMRIRRIAANDINPGAVLKGNSLIKVDGTYQIDNMEGLSITTDKSGNAILSLISDNNHSLLQRNLYLEFRLVGGE